MPEIFKSGNTQQNHNPSADPKEEERVSAKKTEEKREKILKELFDELDESLIKTQIVHYFKENENDIKTCGDFVKETRADIRTIIKVLEKLVDADILEKMGEGQSAMYILTGHEDTRRAFLEKGEKFFENLEKRKQL
jgi:predicted HTH transcriptional regulator